MTALLFFSITTVAALLLLACVALRRSPPADTGVADLRTITDHIPAMVAFVDRDLRYRFVNRNYERWLGVKPEDMLGRTALEVYGEARYAALQPSLERALSGQTFAVDHRVAGHTSGRARWFNIMYMPKTEADGHVSG
ncbi:MAG: PAS domain-containing protein, partial [Rhizobacter sp.]